LNGFTGSGSSSIVESGSHVASGIVTVNGEEELGGGGVSSKKSLSDEEVLSGGRNALALDVDSGHGFGGSGPLACQSDSTGVGVGGLKAVEAGDVEGWVVFGIGVGGDELHGGRVGGPDSIGEVGSLDPHVVDGGGAETGDLGLGDA